MWIRNVFLLLASFAVQNAPAALVSYDFTGTIGGWTTAPSLVGSTMTASVTYDDSAVGTGSSTSKYYEQAVTAFSMSFGGLTFTADTSGNNGYIDISQSGSDWWISFWVHNWDFAGPGSGIPISNRTEAINQLGVTIDDLILNLRFSSSNPTLALPSGALPSEADLVSSNMFTCDGPGCGSTVYSDNLSYSTPDSVSSVPSPAGPFLFLLGVTMISIRYGISGRLSTLLKAS